jgi:sugar lactone lactonase YvrE
MGSVPAITAIYIDGTPDVPVVGGQQAITADAAGNVYVADTTLNVIRELPAHGTMMTLAAALIAAGYSDQGVNQAGFSAPSGLATDTTGTLYVSNAGSHVIQKVTPQGTVTTLAGIAGTSGNADGTGTQASFYQPGAVAVDVTGNVYVADTCNGALRMITPDGVVSTLTGALARQLVTSSIMVDHNSLPVVTCMGGPDGVAVDTVGNVYVADTLNFVILKISNGVVTTMAGGVGISGSIDGNGIAARFAYPTKISLDGSGNLYIVDGGTVVRKMSPDGQVSTLIGTPGQAYFVPPDPFSALGGPVDTVIHGHSMYMLASYSTYAWAVGLIENLP